MAEHMSEDKKGCCGYGRCNSTAAVLIILALMAVSGAIGYLMGKSCSMGRMACMKQGGCAHGAMGGGMAACPVMGGPSQETAPKK